MTVDSLGRVTVADIKTDTIQIETKKTKFKKLKGFEGLNVSTLKKEDTKGFPKQVQDAILEASSNYNVIMSGGEVPEPPSPLQKLTGSMKNLVTQK